MNSRDLERRLSAMAGYAAGELDQRFRALRELGLIPHGPRGPQAPQFEPIHVAIGVLSLVSRRAAVAGEITLRAMNLSSIAPPRVYGLKPMRLGVAVALAIGHGSRVVRSIEVEGDGSLAWVEIHDGGRWHRLVFIDDPEIRDRVEEEADLDEYEATGANFLGHQFKMRAGAIDRLHVAAMFPTESGWVGEVDKQATELEPVA